MLGDVVILQPQGDLDLKLAEELRRAGENLLGRGGRHSLVLDMRRVDFIDSSGLSAILGRYRRVLELQGRMAVSGATPRVASLLELAGVTGLIPLHASLADALAAVKERVEGGRGTSREHTPT
ncbi:MAG TPA: anti-sigma F factor antagonist [Clostridiales bacterium]|nr:anti-sigma F factor antagonist [Clostridiales bacterium]